MQKKSVARNDIFASYSHTDKKWLERLKIHLKPLERDHKVNLWSDTKLKGGDNRVSAPKIGIKCQDV